MPRSVSPVVGTDLAERRLARCLLIAGAMEDLTSPSPSPSVVVLVAPRNEVRTALADALDGAGFVVAQYGNVSRAHRLLDDLAPDLLVVATDSPSDVPDDGEGAAAFGALLARPSTAAAIVTGHASFAAELARTHGAVHVAESLDVASLISVVRQHCIPLAHARESGRGSHVPPSRRSRPSGRSSGMQPRVPGHVLVVEDDPVLCEVLSLALRDEGWATHAVTTARAAREAILSNAPAVLLLDLTLPDGFGGDLLAELATRGALPPTVIVSTFALAELVARRYDVALVRKPFELEALLHSVSRVAAGRRPSRISSAEAGRARGGEER